MKPAPVETVMRWRVVFGDIALFGQLNTCRYLLLMDVARVHYMQRAGFFALALRKRWIMPVAGIDVDFYRPLKPFERFEIGTQVLSWDDRWFFVRQTFRNPGRTASAIATGYAKVVVRSTSGVVEPARVTRILCGRDVQPPVLPDDLRSRFSIGRRSAVPVQTRPPTRHGNGHPLVDIVDLRC